MFRNKPMLWIDWLNLSRGWTINQQLRNASHGVDSKQMLMPTVRMMKLRKSPSKMNLCSSSKHDISGMRWMRDVRSHVTMTLVTVTLVSMKKALSSPTTATIPHQEAWNKTFEPTLSQLNAFLRRHMIWIIQNKIWKARMRDTEKAKQTIIRTEAWYLVITALFLLTSCQQM